MIPYLAVFSIDPIDILHNLWNRVPKPLRWLKELACPPMPSLEGAILRGEHPPATFHGLKDLSAAVDSGRTVGQVMPMPSLAREFYQLIDDKLGGLSGSNEVIRYYLDE